ncbi:MAG TPA: nuclear transport factor 2 family protein, partial [Thermoleophilaceae bacterium]
REGTGRELHCRFTLHRLCVDGANRSRDTAQAMSKDNVEAFRRGLEAGNRGDIDALLDELHPEIEWHSALHMLMGGEQKVFRGHAGVRRMIGDLYETFDEVHIEMSEFRDLGDGLVAIGRTRNRGRASGVETVTPLAFVTEIRDGKTISIRLPRSRGGPRSRRAAE